MADLGLAHPILTHRQAIQRLYTQEMNRVAAMYGLTRIDLDVILFLGNNPAFDTAADIVAQRSMTKSHVSAAVDHLTMLGLMHQQRDVRNRRKVHLALTETAYPILNAGREAQLRFVGIITNGLDDEERQTFQRILTKAGNNALQALADAEQD